MAHAKTVRAYRADLGELRPVERLPDGRVRVDAILTRCGIFEYRNPDGSTRRELRLPEEVFKPESLNSFAIVPVTDDHPPDMLTAETALRFARGSTGDTVRRDGDNVRASIGVFDANLIAKMESGKVQLSCGYTCDLIEKPGVHPVYGQYDAIQTNILGNHVAVVDTGRAGTARVRMDSAVMIRARAGTRLASRFTRGTVTAMAKPARPVPATRADAPSEASPDPNDLASRNAEDPDRDDNGAACAPGENTAGMYDAETGRLTDQGAAKIAAASFALPGKQRLPIHTPGAVKQSMQDFGSQEYDSADEKHAAFNRITSKAAQFGIGTTKFARQHAANLDSKDDPMIDEKTRAQAAKAAKRTKQRDEARARADAAEKDLAAAQGKITSLEADLAAERAKTAPRNDAAEVEFASRVNAKALLLATASRILGVSKIDSAEIVTKVTAVLGAGKIDEKLDDGAIKRAVIKHVDKNDVPADKHPAYVDALFEGAVARADAAAKATMDGANALAAARGAATPAALPTTPAPGTVPAPVVPAPVPHADGLDDEASARARMQARSAGMAHQPNTNGMTKAAVMASLAGR